MSDYKTQPKTLGQAMERKEQSISRFQDTKELSIQVMSSGRDSTLIITTFYKDLSDEEIKEKWLMWRAWFFSKYDVNETTKELTQPFEDNQVL